MADFRNLSGTAGILLINARLKAFSTLGRVFYLKIIPNVKVGLYADKIA